jgi:hypothetical protein
MRAVAILAAFVVFIVCADAVARGDYAMLGGVLVASVVTVRYLGTQLRPPPAAGPAPPEPPPEDVLQYEDRRDILAICRDHGLWIHETLAAGDLAPGYPATADALLADPLSDLRNLADAHVRRVFTEIQLAREGKQ